VAVTALQGLLKSMHATLGKPRLMGQVSYALGGIVTQTLENPQAFVPKSHVGLVLQRVAELSPEFSSSEYLTDTQLSRLTRIPGFWIGGISRSVGVHDHERQTSVFAV